MPKEKPKIFARHFCLRLEETLVQRIDAIKYDLRPKEETTLNEKPSRFQKVEFFSNIRNIEMVKD